MAEIFRKEQEENRSSVAGIQSVIRQTSTRMELAKKKLLELLNRNLTQRGEKKKQRLYWRECQEQLMTLLKARLKTIGEVKREVEPLVWIGYRASMDNVEISKSQRFVIDFFKRDHALTFVVLLPVLLLFLKGEGLGAKVVPCWINLVFTSSIFLLLYLLLPSDWQAVGPLKLLQPPALKHPRITQHLTQEGLEAMVAAGRKKSKHQNMLQQEGMAAVAQDEIKRDLRKAVKRAYKNR